MLLGSYTLVQPLARGGMAEVHLAHGKGRHVALKVLDPRRTTDADAPSLLQHEARMVALLDHPNVAALYDAGISDSLHFLAMEYVHGHDLRGMMQRCDRMPYAIAVSIMMQAAQGLDHAHRRCDRAGRPLRLVHRDVSLSNLMVGFDGVVKVVDFGIARSEMSIVHTRTGIVRGKASYMSPEQCLGEAVDLRTDVFALGVVLYELTTGQRCFLGDNDFEKMEAITNHQFIAPREHIADYPSELESIIRCALSVDPTMRYSSCAQLVEALRRVMRAKDWEGGPKPVAAFMRSLFGNVQHPLSDEEPTVVAATMCPVADDDDTVTRGRRAFRRSSPSLAA